MKTQSRRCRDLRNELFIALHIPINGSDNPREDNSNIPPVQPFDSNSLRFSFFF